MLKEINTGDYIEFKQAIEIVLQHLKFYKEGLEREIDSNRENVIKIIQQDREIEKKDKIIDEMAGYINVRKLLGSCEDNCIVLNCLQEEDCCKQCIKQYFEKKVEE